MVAQIRGIFGNPARGPRLPFPVNGTTATFPQGTMSAGMDGAPGGAPSPYEQPAEKKPSFFGQGGAGRDIAGALGDYLLQMGGMRPMYAPVMQQRQQAAEAEAAHQRQRAEGFEDWRQRQQWEREHPAPGTAYRTEDNAGNVWEMGADGQFKRIFTDETPKVFMQDGQVVTVPNRYAGQTQGGRTVARTGTTPDGRKVVQYADGTIEYGN